MAFITYRHTVSGDVEFVASRNAAQRCPRICMRRIGGQDRHAARQIGHLPFRRQTHAASRHNLMQFQACAVGVHADPAAGFDPDQTAAQQALRQLKHDRTFQKHAGKILVLLPGIPRERKPPPPTAKCPLAKQSNSPACCISSS